MTRRLSLALALLFAVGATACGGEQGTPVGVDWQVGAGADSTLANQLLGGYADGTLDSAFARLADGPYRVTATVVELVPGSGEESRPPFELSDLQVAVLADTLGVFSQTIDVHPGRVTVVSTTASGSLADTASLDASRFLPRDPFPSLLTDDPSFLNPSTRSFFRLRTRSDTLGGLTASVSVADSTADRPLVRVATASRRADGSRTFGAERVSRSAIYDETSQAAVALRASPRGAVPHYVFVRTETTTPGRHRLLHSTWRVMASSAQDSTRNSREP